MKCIQVPSIQSMCDAKSQGHWMEIESIMMHWKGHSFALIHAHLRNPQRLTFYNKILGIYQIRWGYLSKHLERELGSRLVTNIIFF